MIPTCQKVSVLFFSFVNIGNPDCFPVWHRVNQLIDFFYGQESTHLLQNVLIICRYKNSGAIFVDGFKHKVVLFYTADRFILDTFDLTNALRAVDNHIINREHSHIPPLYWLFSYIL